MATKRKLKLVHDHLCSCPCGCSFYKSCACLFPYYFNGSCLQCSQGHHQTVRREAVVWTNNGRTH